MSVSRARAKEDFAAETQLMDVPDVLKMVNVMEFVGRSITLNTFLVFHLQQQYLTWILEMAMKFVTKRLDTVCTEISSVE